MKKIYIQPTIEIEIIEASDILAGSPTLEEENYDGTKPEDVDPIVKPGGEDNFAKRGNTWFDDTDW